MSYVFWVCFPFRGTLFTKDWFYVRVYSDPLTQIAVRQQIPNASLFPNASIGEHSTPVACIKSV